MKSNYFKTLPKGTERRGVDLVEQLRERIASARPDWLYRQLGVSPRENRGGDGLPALMFALGHACGKMGVTGLDELTPSGDGQSGSPAPVVEVPAPLVVPPVEAAPMPDAPAPVEITPDIIPDATAVRRGRPPKVS